jgi:outer membrane immunogenic protein
MKKLLLSIALATLAVGTVQAADPIMPIDPIIEIDNTYDWSGLYIGAFAGFGSGTSFDTGPVNVPLQGALVGVDIGGNAQFGRFVLGAEGDIAWSNIGGNVGCPAPAQLCTDTLGWLGTARIRGGIALNRVLLYVHGGFAAGQVTATTAPPDLGTTGTSTLTASGWTGGAGAEFAVGQRWSLKAEYAFTSISGTAPAGTVAVPASTINPQFHTVKFGANFHF